MKISLAMGFFDSVHIGHRQLIARNRDYALCHGLTPAVHTFSNDIGEYFGSKQLYTFKEREILLKNAGASLIISDIFSEEMKNKDGKLFLDELCSKYDIGAFFCGYDYTFGKDALYNASYLADYATHNNIYCEILPPYTVDDKKVSTSHIKQLLSCGEVERANSLLGSPYSMCGKVVHGRGVGTGFGYPTANIEHNGFLPKDGVYKTIVSIGDAEYLALTNIGAKPTFNITSMSVETMLIDFDGNLYDKEITLKFIKYIRPIRKFRDGNELMGQIQKDIKEALC